MSAHTPGPWAYDFGLEPGHASEFMVLASRNAVLAYVAADEARGVEGPTVEANARLIAAAPRMAEALDRAYWALVKLNAGEYVDFSAEYIAIGEVLHVAGVFDHPERGGREP